MASELQQGRRRAKSSAQRPGKPSAPIEPKSSHTSDPFLRDFLSPNFDPASYLNSKLPALATKSASGASLTASGAVPLTELSKQANTLLSQVNAQTTRLLDTLTLLTDDILRSGSRLAYEVELLRGETLNLSEALNETLKEDIAVFIPGGLESAENKKAALNDGGEAAKGIAGDLSIPTSQLENMSLDPLPVQQLKTLTLVRSRIETVIKTFGDAMDFSFPPSEVSVSSSFLSVSAPEPGADDQNSEEKGKAKLQKLRDEITELLQKSEDPVTGIETAANRIEDLKAISQVWKDTAEEKGRQRFIDSLAKMVEERHKELVKETGSKADGPARAGRAGGGAVPAVVAHEDGRAPPGGFGLINQLQKLRGGV